MGTSASRAGQGNAAGILRVGTGRFLGRSEGGRLRLVVREQAQGRLVDPRSYSAWSRGPFTGALEVGRRLQGSREDRGALALASRLRSALISCVSPVGCAGSVWQGGVGRAAPTWKRLGTPRPAFSGGRGLRGCADVCWSVCGGSCLRLCAHAEVHCGPAQGLVKELEVLIF